MQWDKRRTQKIQIFGREKWNFNHQQGNIPGINKPGVYINKVNIYSIYNDYIINILVRLIYNSQLFSKKEMELAIKNLTPLTLAPKYIKNNSLKSMCKIYMRKINCTEKIKEDLNK